MSDEQLRRAWLGAMQIDVWLPRQALPFAAPSRPELLVLPEPLPEPPRPLPARPQAARPAQPVASEVPAAAPPAETARRIPLPAVAPRPRETPPVRAVATPPPPLREAPPRFALQVLRAGTCLLLCELPTGEVFASRDPAYLLLRDLLRAAGLPDSPQPLGEPIRWPMLRGNGAHFDQGPQAARLYVQTVLQSRLDEAPARCLWLIGDAAQRFAAEKAAPAGEDAELDGLGLAWSLPGLDRLMEAPPLKAGLWHSMRRIRRRWTDEA